MNGLLIKEHDVLRQTKDLLRFQGWYIIRHQASMGSHPGLCDIQAVKDGYTLYIETKSTNGKPTEDQSKFILAMAEHGITVHVINNVELLDPILKDLFERGLIKSYNPMLF